MNGATAVVYESLRGNSVFVARLIDSGNLVLVHPMKSWLAGMFVTYVLSEAGLVCIHDVCLCKRFS